MSRYYDPVTHRFINADGYFQSGSDILEVNMFAYCGNNPIMYYDPNGEFFGIVFAVIATAVAVTIAIVSVIVIAHVVAIRKIENSDANDAEKKIAHKDYFGAYHADKSRTIADQYTKKIYGDYTEDDTEANAYKHAMWNAVMTDKMGAEKAKLFADAHEDLPGNSFDKKEMDLHNNELGRQIAIKYAGQGYDIFSEKIQEAIKDGEAVILKKWD